jgi:Kef-type K+ transport system membrane component KefB
MLAFVAGIDGVVGLAILGIVFCFTRIDAVPGPDWLVVLAMLGGSIGTGAVMGGMLHLLTRIRCGQEELLLFTIGIVVFSAGLAVYLGMSPLFVTAIGGFVLGNTRSAKVRILRVLTTLEKPFYIVILLIGGALIRFDGSSLTLLLLATMYIGLRLAGKVAGGFLAARVLKDPKRLPAGIGFGLISQGGISAAMVVSYHHAAGDLLAGNILLVVLMAITVNELISPALTYRLIRKGM